MSCYSPCNCGNYSCQTCYPVAPCILPAGCPIQLDSACVFYHQGNNQLSGLTNLGLSNGATLELILDTIDDQLEAVKVDSFNLPVLRVDYVIHTLKQFSEAVDTEIASLRAGVAGVVGTSSTPFSATDSATIDFSTSGTLGHTLTGSVKVSATSDNRVSAVSDGIYAAPQTLSVNYTTKELTIVGGNTVSLSSLASGTSGWLGNVAVDPTAIDGQYWFNTSGGGALKIKVNGTVREIQLV